MERRLKILQVSPEVAPFAKTGGLADVASALPQALSRLGHEVFLIMPRHKQVRKSRKKLTETARITVPVADRYEEAEVYQARLDRKVTTYLIDKEKYFDRDPLYGTPEGDYPDNCERFVFFCRAAIETALALDLKPDVVHCHDWQSALIPLYIQLFYQDTPLARAATVFTVHNMAYQGIFWALDLPLTSIPESHFTPEGVEFYGKINFLKAGLVYSHLITTVSEGYSREIQTEEYGYGLDGVLRKRSADLYGIINGVDYKEWDPATDKFIVANYDSQNLEGKRRCKEDLMKQVGLKGLGEKPLIGMVSRMAEQKGFDILAEAMGELMALELGMVILGTGDEKYQNLFAEMPKRFPEKLAVKLAFDNPLAHKIEAGCDMFLMPSKYEPCGLNQMYSLKYGTIPIVRATGGLDDTIENFDPTTEKGNGFKFIEYSAQELIAKVKEAVELFHEEKAAWRKLIQNAMACDFSWERSAEKYVKVYEKALEKIAICEGNSGGTL